MIAGLLAVVLLEELSSCATLIAVGQDDRRTVELRLDPEVR